MSGHSKWSTIKHKKGALDAKRGALFTKLAREVTVAAKAGGGDPGMNPRLRLAIDKARQGNMPLDNIERAIKKGTGEGSSAADFVEVFYEGYGPGGAALLVQVLTDNKNRTASDVRTIFSRGGGNLGGAGSVAWQFEQRAVLTAESVAEESAEDAELAAIDAGADDVNFDDGTLRVTGEPTDLDQLASALRDAGVEPNNASLEMVPKTLTALESSQATQTMRLIDKLEDLDDVQNVFTNADFPEEALAAYSSA